jgi:hypothetical protein
LLVEVFRYLELLRTAKSGRKRVPPFFWNLSQRQRRIVVAGLWDGDGSHVFKKTTILAQKSHGLIHDVYHCLVADGLFPHLKRGQHGQLVLTMSRADDFRRFADLYPLRHPTKLAAYQHHAQTRGRDKATGLWKCPGIWKAVAEATLPPGLKTQVYNAGGKYDHSFRAQRSAFACVSALRPLVDSRLAFLRVAEIEERQRLVMYDLSVEGAENFLANGILAHNSGYPDCRPEYVEAFMRLANLATKAGVERQGVFCIHTPLIRLTKAEIIRLGTSLGLDYGLTHSCYDPSPDGAACGRCDSCLLRRKGFLEAGVADPTRYVAAPFSS